MKDLNATLDDLGRSIDALPDVAALTAERDELRAQLATARAVAFEEAARHLEGEHKPNCYDRAPSSSATILDPCCSRCSHANQLRVLAPLPPSLVAVPVEVLAQVLRLCRGPASDWCGCVGDGDPRHDPGCHTGQVIAALEKLVAK